MIVKQCAVERAYDSQRLNVLDVHNEYRAKMCQLWKEFWRVYAQGYMLIVLNKYIMIVRKDELSNPYQSCVNSKSQ